MCVFSFHREMILGLKHLCKSRELQKAGNNKYNWLLVLPILHFYRKDCIPCSDVALTMDYDNPKWWGVEDLGVDRIEDISDQ